MRRWISLALVMTTLWGICGAWAEEETAAVRYEWEDGELLGRARVGRAGDTGWVENLTGQGDGAVLKVLTEQEGFYDLTVCQASQGGHKENNLLLDGESIGTISVDTAAYAESTTNHVWLDAGEHTVSVTSSWGYVKLDWLEVAPSSALPANLYDVPPVLCNPAPSPQAQALMDWLCEVYGKKMISGQYLDEWQKGSELEAVASVTGGRYPALVGLDLLNYSPTSASMGTRGISVDQAIDYWRKGHIVTMCWHWVAPKAYVDTAGNNWWGGFYTEKTTLDIGKAMSGEDPTAYEMLLSDMDAIAVQLARLRDAGVPVLWRPLHEASGGWFWWGAHGPEPYIQLYRLMYDRFTNLHGLNNLIWVWNGQDAAWYPGDDVVDIVGEDIYAGYHAHDSQSAAFLRCNGYTPAKKLVMLSECGCVPSPVKCERDGTMWSSWAVWCYEFVQVNGAYNSAYTSADTLKLFYEQDNVITLADVPSLGRDAAAAEEEQNSGSLTWAFTDGELSGSARKAGEVVQLWGNAADDAVTLTVSVPAEGDYRLIIRQAGIGGGKENYLAIDGTAAGNTVVSGETEEACEFGTVHLTAGEHQICVSAFWGWVELRDLTLVPARTDGVLQQVEFEDGELLGNVKITAIGKDKYVELASNDEQDGVRVTVTAPADGWYDLVIIQNGIGGYKENYLAIDGERVENTVVQGTQREECVTGPVWLTAGEHTVTVTCFWGWADLDALQLKNGKQPE